MKPAPRSMTLPALSTAVLVTLIVGSAACGDEAALPPGTGTGSTASTGGSTVVPTGGSAGSPAATAGTTSTPAAGTSSVDTGGTGNSAGTGTTAGTGTSAGTSSGGTGTTAGTSSGGSSAGTTSMAGTSSGGTSGGDLKETVAGTLNGAMLLGKCLNKTAESVCQTNAGACPGANADAALSGIITTDKTITLGGDPAKVYTITLHVQGEVESKKYDGGADQSSTGASPKADGFCVGGTPSNGDAYNVYMARVSSPKKDYFFNSIQPPGVSNHTTYGIDYTAKITANGGATIRLVAADKNCSMIRNCGPQENSGNVCSAPITLGNIDPVATSKNPTFDFTKAFDGQWVVMVVTDVTAG